MDLTTNGSSTAAVRGNSTFSPDALQAVIYQQLLQLWSEVSLWQLLMTAILVLAAYDQYVYYHKKGSIAGATFKIPFIGAVAASVNPTFEGYVAQWASGPLSCISVLHKFVVLVSERDLARKAFHSAQYIKPCVVPIADGLMGGNPWVLLDGKAHVDYRKGLNGLFTRKALECYLPVQEKVWSQYFEKFVEASKANNGKPIPFMGHFREIGCALSCRTFTGDYISEDAVKKIADEFYCITDALELIEIPLTRYIPYTRAWLGMRAARNVLTQFAKAAAASKVQMAAGKKPSCVVDCWILNMIESKRYSEQLAAGITDAAKPSVLVREFSDFEISQTLFTFLFASQDASSSATTYIFQILAQRPDVLARIREENLAARGGDPHGAITLPMLESLTYTNAVVKETLRYRPPVIFVPYLAKKAFPITPNYTIPKNSLVIPSCYPALHDPEAYPQPEVFDPERWISGTAAEQTKNWMVFGTGPHQCIAQSYVQLTMVGMMGKASLEIDWRHHATPTSEQIRVFATLFPMVSQNYIAHLAGAVVGLDEFANLINRMTVPWFLRRGSEVVC